MLHVVTGGAGFIGSHLVDALVKEGKNIVVIDSLSSGDIKHISGHIEKGLIRFVKADLLGSGWQDELKGVERVWHIAADPDVRQGGLTPSHQVENNLIATTRLLEAMRVHRVPEIVFTSTSTVYGEAKVIPTPEDYTPLEPISVYGATKLACEAMISAYCHSFNMQCWLFRFANIIGERSNHGVIWDFVHKLKKDPNRLEILGNGKQTKSYLIVSECVDAIIFGSDKAKERVNTYNIGSPDWVSVTDIADIIVTEMGLSGVQYNFTGGERGWVGDVPLMQLSIEKIQKLGFVSSTGSRESVSSAVRAMFR